MVLHAGECYNSISWWLFWIHWKTEQFEEICWGECIRGRFLLFALISDPDLQIYHPKGKMPYNFSELIMHNITYGLIGCKWKNVRTGISVWDMRAYENGCPESGRIYGWISKVPILFPWCGQQLNAGSRSGILSGIKNEGIITTQISELNTFEKNMAVAEAAIA